MHGCVTSIERETLASEDYRRALLTGRHARADEAAPKGRAVDGT